MTVPETDTDEPSRAAQHLTGVVPDESNLYPELTGFGNLCFCATLHGMRKKEREARAGELLKTFGLEAAAHREFAGYSKGMKRKLTIAAGIIHRPPILFLDEPTTGIDVASARQTRQLIAGLHRSGTTIFLTTHYIEEAERLCNRIAFIVSGRIVRIDSVQNLVQPAHEKQRMEIAFSNSVPSLLPGVMGVSVLFGTTSLLAIIVTFEKKGRSFERLLLGAIRGAGRMPAALDFGVLAAFCVVLFAASVRNIRRRWIV